jgi:hypothetical protein
VSNRARDLGGCLEGLERVAGAAERLGLDAGPATETLAEARARLGFPGTAFVCALAGGTAVLNQKLLEALIGEAAVADIIRAAERDLRRTLRSALETDARRFLDPLAQAGDGPAALREAADRVLAEAERLIDSLAGTGR